ncbi:MAG: HD-GYP domain-containing protein [Clostridium sp.]|uniref:HD-GYP domain-containing protein n=1 Tax=Clostridium sp. TaxID=1506 RepID=UPI0039EC8430
MRLEFMDRVKENDILGRNIYTSEGNILLRAGVKLNALYIEKLKEVGIIYIYVEDNRLDDVEEEDKQLLELKSLTMKNMSKIIKNISGNTNKKESIDSLKIIEDLIDYIIEMGDVNKYLYNIQTYDNYTYAHSIDTGIMSTFLGEKMNLNENELKELGMGAILHDIGKTRVPISIINKTGSLTGEEYDEIKKHPIYGKEILERNFKISSNVIKVITEHHERVDGTGYPYGLKGYQISKLSKIACICDVYDSIMTDRCYRKKFAPNDAYELILAGSGSLFDDKIVKGFKNTFSVYPLGCCVKLSNGIEGYVIKQNPGFPDKPIIRVLYDINTKKPVQFYEIDLVKSLNLVVESIV